MAANGRRSDTIPGDVQTQNPAKWPTKDSVAALEIINRMQPDRDIDRLVAPLRPVSSKFSGGDFTALFAAR